jgi:hypothetical protein
MKKTNGELASQQSAQFIKEKSVFELIEEALNYFRANQPLKSVSVTKYQNKQSPADVLYESDLVKAWKMGINPNDYEAVTETVNQSEKLRKFLCGDSANFEVPDFDELKNVCSILNSNEASNPIEMRQTKHRVYNVAGGAIKTITLDQAIEEAKAVYSRYGKVFTYNPKGKKAKPAARSAETEPAGESGKIMQEA